MVENPRLILQSPDKEIVVYEFLNNKWEFVFIIPEFTYNLKVAFDRYIIADHPESFNVKLFETTVDLTRPIITELDISNSFRPRELDSSSIEQMSLLLYDQYGKHVDFNKMKQGRTVFHTNLNYIDQVCSDYLVSFKNDFTKGYIENDYIQNI